jgi:AAA domain
MTSASVITPKSSPLHEILQWSASRPDWQRDALRRIVEKGNLDSTDIEELERIARSKIKNVKIKPAPQAAQPLTVAHLPSAPGVVNSVSLLSLSDVKNVNRLPDGSSLPLGTGTGLTIVYGENGAGKSSYARIIKKVCRSRGASPTITPNVFASPSAIATASSTISFQVANSNHQFGWTNGTPADPMLANVFVFDGACADHYLGSDDEAAFTPNGLDILPKLSKTCDLLSERLRKDIEVWTQKIAGAKANWKYDPTTKVGILVDGLSDKTKDSEVTTLVTLSTQEAQRLITLRDALKADPLKKAKETRAARDRVDAFLQRVKGAAALLSDAAEKLAGEILNAAIDSADAAKAFASGQFDPTFLQGTGSELWRKLWEAAREYAVKESYPDGEFPSTSPNARCVLCQQDLDEAARSRFAQFDAFCKDKSQEIAVESERKLTALTINFRPATNLYPELQKIEADLSILNAVQVTSITEFVTAADERLQQIKQALDARQWKPTCALPPAPETILQDAIKALEDRETTEKAASDPVARKVLETELKELAAREWLSGVQGNVLEQIERHKIVAELEGCRKDLNTTQITTKSNDLADTFVTAAFKSRFQVETKKLGLTTLSVAMDAARGKKGIVLFGLRLIKAINGTVAAIASEGERRCVALAAFLAELSQASHLSALVFDDPVSSLDHRHRYKIAERLVSESAVRQVIVFAHEVIFLNDLLTLAENASQSPHILTLDWDNSAPGKCVEGLPWDRKNPNDCLDALDKIQAAIAAKWNPHPSTTNVDEMRNAYSLLRSVMERIVEKELLDGIIQRFESQVVAGKVKYLLGVTQNECDETKRLLQKCHDLTNAHAPSMAPIPTPSDLKQDIADARTLIATIRARKKTIK